MLNVALEGRWVGIREDLARVLENVRNVLEVPLPVVADVFPVVLLGELVLDRDEPVRGPPLLLLPVLERLPVFPLLRLQPVFLGRRHLVRKSR